MFERWIDDNEDRLTADKCLKETFSSLKKSRDINILMSQRGEENQ